MNKVMVKPIVETGEPAYCKDCDSGDSFVRRPKRDIYSDAGVLLWEGWQCRYCGYFTIRKVGT